LFGYYEFLNCKLFKKASSLFKNWDSKLRVCFDPVTHPAFDTDTAKNKNTKMWHLRQFKSKIDDRSNLKWSRNNLKNEKRNCQWPIRSFTVSYFVFLFSFSCCCYCFLIDNFYKWFHVWNKWHVDSGRWLHFSMFKRFFIFALCIYHS